MTPAPNAPTGGGKRKTRLLAYGPRIVAVVATLAVGWYTVRTFHDLLSGPAPAVQAADDPAVAPENVVGTAEGPWTFAGQPWRLRVAAVPAADLEARLYRTPADEPAAGDGKAFLALVRGFADRKATRDGWTVYECHRGGLRGTAFTRGQGDGERLAAARAAFPTEGGWTLMEVEPSPAAAPAASTAPSLLPMPEGSTRAAVRCDEAGRVLGELVSSPGDVERVKACCRAQGWADGGDGPFLWFRKGGETVQAWAASGPAGGTVLFLTRVGPSRRAS